MAQEDPPASNDREIPAARDEVTKEDHLAVRMTVYAILPGITEPLQQCSEGIATTVKIADQVMGHENSQSGASRGKRTIIHDISEHCALNPVFYILITDYRDRSYSLMASAMQRRLASRNSSYTKSSPSSNWSGTEFSL